MAHKESSPTVDHLALSVEKLYTTDQAACLRIAPAMLRRLRAIGKRISPEIAETTTLRIKGIQSLIAQDRGVSTAPARTLAIATRLGRLGEWRRAAYFVFECYMSDGSIPNPHESRYWAKWIVDRAPIALKPMYVRVASLLRSHCCVDAQEIELALRYFRKSAGDIPSEYRSRQVVSFLSLYTEALYSGTREMWPAVGQALLDSAADLDERSRLKEMLRIYSLNTDSLNRKLTSRYLEDVASVAKRKGFMSIHVKALNIRANHLYDRYNDQLYLSAMDQALAFGRTRCGKTDKCFRLASASFSTQGDEKQQRSDMLKKHFSKMIRCHPHTNAQYSDLITTEMTLYPKRIKSIARDFLARYDAQARERIKVSVIFPALKFADNGITITAKNGNHLCLESVLSYAEEQYRGMETDASRMRTVVHGLRREVPRSRSSSMSISKMKSLTLAKVRHDLKYHLDPLRRLMKRADSGEAILGESLKEAVKALLAMFRSSEGIHSVEQFFDDINMLAKAISNLTQSTHVDIVLPSPPAKRNVQTDRYDDLMSILFNVLHNASTHSAEGASVKVCLLMEGEFLLMILCENVMKDSITYRPDYSNHERVPRYGSSDINEMPTYSSHGHGSRIIAQLAAKLGLKLKVEVADSMYRVQISVPLC